MNFKKRIFFALVILLILFIANIFISTGFFRTIENNFDGEILEKIDLYGTEDITISKKDSFAIISSTKRNKFPNIQQEIGDLYLIDLKSKKYNTVHLSKDFKKPFAPHGISMFQQDSVTTLAVINHTLEGEFVEIFELQNQKLIHKRTIENEMIFSPNDIVLLDHNRFYFTNDHKYKEGLGRLSEDYLGLSISNVVYFDGNKFSVAAEEIAYANGINFDSNRKLIFVASPRKFLVKVFQQNEDSSLTFIEDIDCKTGVDNIEFDDDYNLWIGSHPNLLHFAAYAKGDENISPSEIIKINYKNKGDYTIEQIYMDDGTKMSASTVAAPFGDIVLTGNVMDDHFLILKINKN
jgi:arylesterase / paraoxonase